MTWLKKAGLVLGRVLGFVTGLAPLVGPAFGEKAGAAAGSVGSEVSNIVNVIATIEGAFTAVNGPTTQTGPQKLKAASPFVAKIIMSTDALAGAKVKDEAKFNTAVTAITGAFADLLNSLDENSMKTGDLAG